LVSAINGPSLQRATDRSRLIAAIRFAALNVRGCRTQSLALGDEPPIYFGTQRSRFAPIFATSCRVIEPTLSTQTTHRRRHTTGKRWDMGTRRQFSREFKLEAVRLVRECGVSVVQASRGIVVRFGFVAKHRGAWPMSMMCETLGVSRSGWPSRPRSQRSLQEEVLGCKVRLVGTAWPAPNRPKEGGG
jgi:hypothetical protein